MTDHETTALLHRASQDLPLDLEALVAGGRRRGRVRRRRARLTGTATALALAALVTAGATTLAVDDIPSIGSAGAGSSDTAPLHRPFGVPMGETATTLESLLPPGPVTQPYDFEKPGDPGYIGAVDQGAVLTYRGGVVSLVITDLTTRHDSLGWPAGGAAEACRLQQAPCRAVGHGDWLLRTQVVTNPSPGAATPVYREAALFTHDGFEVSAVAYDAEGTGQPVLSATRLEHIARSPVWLQ